MNDVQDNDRDCRIIRHSTATIYRNALVRTLVHLGSQEHDILNTPWSLCGPTRNLSCSKSRVTALDRSLQGSKELEKSASFALSPQRASGEQVVEIWDDGIHMLTDVVEDDSVTSFAHG